MKVLKRIIPFTISGFSIVVLLFLQFAVLRTNEEFSWSEFLPTLLVNITLLITTAITWINAGTERAKSQEQSAYKDNNTIYSNQIKDITDAGELSQLRAFCEAKTHDLLEEKKIVALANVGIDYKTYQYTLANMSVEELANANYAKRQIKAIQRVKNGKIRVKPISSIDILSDSRTIDGVGVNYNERADKSVRIAIRAFKAVLISTFLALCVPDLAEDITSIAAWAMFLLRCYTIIYTAFSSEREGYARITDTKNKVIMRRIAFLNEFAEWVKVPKLNPGKEEKRSLD